MMDYFSTYTYWRYGIVQNLDDNKFHLAEVYLKNGKVMFYFPVGFLQIIKDLRRVIRDINAQEKFKFGIVYLDRKFHTGDLYYYFCPICKTKRLFMKLEKKEYNLDLFDLDKDVFECMKCGGQGTR